MTSAAVSLRPRYSPRLDVALGIAPRFHTPQIRVLGFFGERRSALGEGGGGCPLLAPCGRVARIAALGALIVMAPTKVLKHLIRGVIQTVKGTPYERRAYAELFQVLNDLFQLARRGVSSDLRPAEE